MAAITNYSTCNRYPLSAFPIARNLTKKQIEIIDQKISGIKADIWQWACDFNSHPYEGDFWNHRNYRIWPLYAFHAHRTGNLSALQVASICFQYAVVDQFIYKTQRYWKYYLNGCSKFTITTPIEKAIFNKPEWIHVKNERFKEMLIGAIGVRKTERGKYPYYGFQKQAEVKKIADSIIKALKNAPKSEQYLFMIDGVENINDHSEILSLFEEFHSPFHGNMQMCGKKLFVIPSFTILQLFFKTLRPAFAVGLDPVIGRASTKDVGRSRRQNLRLVSLPMEEVLIPKVADGRWAGNAGAVIHDACYHAFKIARLFVGENKAIIHIVENLLDPYILENQEKFDDNLNTFFRWYDVDCEMQVKISEALKFSNYDLDIIINDSMYAYLGEKPPLDVRSLHTVSDELLESLIPSNKEDLREDLNNLKNHMLKLRIAKRFRWKLEDGDLWENFSGYSHNPFFEDDDLKSLFALNFDIFDLIFSDMQNNEALWKEEFEIVDDRVF